MEFNSIKICLVENIYLNNRLKHFIGDNVKNVCYINAKNRYFLLNIGDRCSATAEGIILMNIFDTYEVKQLGKIYKDLTLLKDVADKDILIYTVKKDIYEILISMFVEMFKTKNIKTEIFTSDKLGRMITRESV